MRIGIVARADDRGIGNQTWEAWRHLPDAHALVVDMGSWAAPGFPQHFDRYAAGAGRDPDWVVQWDEQQHLPENTCRRFLETIDVLYSVETFYDPRLIGWARDAGVRTVLHVNPELHDEDQGAAVDRMWLPTPWLADQAPFATARVVPYPVALDRFRPYRRRANTRSVLHVAGKAAYLDRNGTRLAAAASKKCCPPWNMWVSSQDEHVALGAAIRVPTAVDYWRLYDLGDVLLMPRRFGGLCLPIQEAMAAGLAIVTLDASPADFYDATTIPSEQYGSFQRGSIDVPLYTATDDAIADTLMRFVVDPDALDAAHVRSRQWAFDHSWRQLLERWLAELES